MNEVIKISKIKYYINIIFYQYNMNYQGNWIPETQKSLDRKRFIKEKYLKGGY